MRPLVDVNEEIRNAAQSIEAMNRRDALVADLELAAIALRDSELAVRAAQKRYAEALQAFNQHVAPVVP